MPRLGSTSPAPTSVPCSTVCAWATRAGWCSGWTTGSDASRRTPAWPRSGASSPGSFDSRPSRGPSSTMTLPDSLHEKDLPASLRPVPLLRRDALVVLIVDDVPDNVAPLHDALDEAGYDVLVALDGETALRRAVQALPDVILLDAVMPGIDGFEVARRLKADERT